MAAEERCETHVWASVGITTRSGQVSRIWECEQCRAWTAEPFNPDLEIGWDETWLSDR